MWPIHFKFINWNLGNSSNLNFAQPFYIHYIPQTSNPRGWHLCMCVTAVSVSVALFLLKVRWGICHAVSQVTPACFPTLLKCVLTSRFASKLCLDKAGESEPKGTDCSCVGLGNWVLGSLTVQSLHFNHSCLVLMMIQTDYMEKSDGPSENSRLSMANCLSCMFGSVRPIAEIAYSA